MFAGGGYDSAPRAIQRSGLEISARGRYDPPQTKGTKMIPAGWSRRVTYPKKIGGPILSNAGFMRYLLIPPSAMIHVERFSILPTHRINFKRGPDPAVR